MSNPPGKYGNVRNFLDNLGNEKIAYMKKDEHQLIAKIQRLEVVQKFL